jgi:hypothetical protein
MNKQSCIDERTQLAYTLQLIYKNVFSYNSLSQRVQYFPYISSDSQTNCIYAI